jgi:anthranilate phosphoribosyltransferase
MAMRELALHPQIPDGDPTVDTVGTGGDGSGSLNLSTATGLLAAACGARVVKHGNRSISSKSGSADMLEQLGMPLPLDEQAVIDCLDAINFTFLFAPAYHPAMKAIMPVRNSLGVRTVFNMLGPLTNPAAPPFQLIGTFSKDAARLMAETLTGMPIERAFVVHGEPGWDEATPVGEFVLYDAQKGSVEESVRTPEQYGLSRCQPEDLTGGDAEHNANELRRVFANEDKGPHRDALLMGTSLVLEVVGMAGGAKEGVEMAASGIDNGAAAKLLDDMKAHFGIA